jgi:PhnB protein
VTDPFDQLATPVERRDPRPSFARALRRRVVAELGLDPLTATPTIDLPRRKPVPDTTTSTSAPTTPADLTATPYLCVHDGAGAIDWYVEAFGAVEQFRVVGDDGVLGHAELTVGAARFMLSDEYPALGVVSPRTLGSTAVAIHLELADVDATFARAVAAGASALREPEDQPHGARHGTLVDPYGHRWMLSQRLEQLTVDEYAARSEGSGFRVQHGPLAGTPYVDGIWASMTYVDPEVGIRFVTEVLGFEELVLVRGDDGGIVHSEYRWPEGGIVGIAGADDANPFLPPAGQNGLYVVTQDPQAVWDRCRAAGVDVIREPGEPHYDPGGMVFAVRDPEGNAWSFGSYAGGSTG